MIPAENHIVIIAAIEKIIALRTVEHIISNSPMECIIERIFYGLPHPKTDIERKGSGVLVGIEGVIAITGFDDFEGGFFQRTAHQVTHHEIVLAAAAAGKAIFCEKPTSLSLASTDEMIAAVEKVGVIFQVGFMRRFDHEYAQLKSLIDSGDLGRALLRHGLEHCRFALPGRDDAAVDRHGIEDPTHRFHSDVVRTVTVTESMSDIFKLIEKIIEPINAQITVSASQPCRRGGCS